MIKECFKIGEYLNQYAFILKYIHKKMLNNDIVLIKN